VPVTPSPIPGLVGRAESALGALLAPVLAEAGVTFPQWVVINLTATIGRSAGSADGAPAVDRGRLIAEARAARGFTPGDVAAAIGDLQAAGAVAAGAGQVVLTTSGQATYAQVQARLAEITACLFDQPEQDLAAARRVLTTLTARAQAAHASR
jgi:DNA-binding MarR family transcriptional regulator